LAPRSPEVANNSGWSLLARGQWHEAIPPLEQAAALDPSSKRIAANLELARAALADGLPERRRGESAADWAARLNDAGMVARLRGDRKRAIAAFARAIEARTDWFERAANNLAATESAK
jgi:tetratricopeptide (TPR) repeat protein